MLPMRLPLSRRIPIRPPFHSIVAIVLWILFFNTASFAQTNRVLVCFGSHKSTSALEQRLVQEIDALGYAIDDDGRCAPRTSEEAAALLGNTSVPLERRGQAVVTFDETTKEGAVWVQKSRNTGMIERHVELDESAKLEDTEIAVRIAELVRAAFVERDTASVKKEERSSVRSTPNGDGKTNTPSSAGNDADPPTVRSSALKAPSAEGTRVASRKPMNVEVRGDASRASEENLAASSQPSAWTVEMSGAASALTFDYPPAFHLTVGGAWQPRRLIGPSFALFIPMYPVHIRKEEGTVTVRKGILFIGARVSFYFAGRRLGVDLGAGVGLDVTFINGEAASDLSGRTAATFAALPFGSTGLSVRMSKRAAFVTSVLVGTDVPRTRVSIVKKPVMTTAPIFLSGLLGVRISI